MELASYLIQNIIVSDPQITTHCTSNAVPPTQTDKKNSEQNKENGRIALNGKKVEEKQQNKN